MATEVSKATRLHLPEKIATFIDPVALEHVTNLQGVLLNPKRILWRYCTILMILHSNWSLALLKVLPQFCRHASIYIYKPSHISAKSLRRILFSILSQIPALNSKELFEKQGKHGKARPCQSQWLFLVRCQIHTNSKNTTSRTTSKGSRKKLIIFCNNISLFACGPAHKIRLVLIDQQRSQNLFLDS